SRWGGSWASWPAPGGGRLLALPWWGISAPGRSRACKGRPAGRCPRKARGGGVRVKGPGGSVVGYFAGMGDGQVMFIEPREWEHGSDGAEPGFDRLFPCSRFSLARAAPRKVTLGFSV